MAFFSYILMTLTLVPLVLALFTVRGVQRRYRAEGERQKALGLQLRREIDDAKRASGTHATRELLLEQVIERASDGILVFGTDGENRPSVFSNANAAACRLLEYEKEVLLTLSPMDIELMQNPEIERRQPDVDLVSIDNTEQLGRNSVFALRFMQRTLQVAMNGTPVCYESSIVTRTGRRVPVAITVSHIDSSTRSRFVYELRDITGRRQTDGALRESQQRFKDFFSACLSGAAIYDDQHCLKSVNSACLRIFGSPHKEDFSQLNLFDASLLPPGTCERIARGDNIQCEIVFNFDQMIEEKRFVSHRRGKANIELYFRNVGTDHDHNPLGHLVQVRDITDQREIEATLQMRQAQLRQAQKMQAIGTMTGGIAHDFNNILTPILGYAEISLEFCDASSQLHEFIKEIRTATLRAKELVHQILIFSRQSDEANTRINLAPIVKEVAKQQASILPDNISVNYVIKCEQALVLADPTQIHQILTNFSTNAAYAMRETGGRLDIQLSRFTMGWRHRQEFPELKKGSYLRITVADTGCGIPETIQDHIFDPFFSTKPKGEGTGMGLAVVKGIVDSLGGAIALETKVNEGTTLHVALPIVDQPQIEEPTVWQSPYAHGEQILFVDDEPSIATLATPLLLSLGYAAEACTSSQKALDLFCCSPERFDLLITDQVMPEMTGTELVRNVRAIRPDLPVIICSGFSGHCTPEETDEMGINAFLVKPVTRRELGEAIQVALQSTVIHRSGQKTPADPPRDEEEQREL